MIKNLKKCILIDFSLLMHRAINCAVKNPQVIPTYLVCLQIFAYLKRIGIDPDDLVVLAYDLGRSWRKEESKEYKSDRAAKRQSIRPKEWWDDHFARFNKLKLQLDISTPWIGLQIDSVEADDIIAVSTRFFKEADKVVIVSTDHDFDQLCIYPNVRIYSPLTKLYRKVENPYQELAKKSFQEKTDGLVSEITTDEEYQKRQRLVDLTNLPEEIEQKVIKKLEGITYKENWDINNFPFPSLRERFYTIYNSDDIVSEDELSKSEKKKIKLKAKKLKETEEF